MAVANHLAIAEAATAARQPGRGLLQVAGRLWPRLPRPGQPPLLPALRAIGQFRASYILAEGADGLYILDQHAAHERVRYEELLEALTGGEVASQFLAVPVPVTLTPNQARLLEQHIIRLADLGVVLEYFGGASFLIRALPRGLPAGREDKLLTDLLDLAEDAAGESELLPGWLRAVACHGAIQANQPLSREEMNGLLESLAACQAPFTCPHGRPAVFRLADREIASRFDR